MKRLLYLSFIGAALFIMLECSTDGVLQECHHNSELLTKSSCSSQEVLVKHRMLSEEELRDVVEEKFGLIRTRGTSEYSVETITEDDKPLLHIANISSGGWAIVAGDVREENQILAFGESGTFDPDSIINPGVKLWFEMAKSQMESVEYSEESIIANGESASSMAQLASLPPFDDEYVWVRLPLEPVIQRDQENVDHLLATKWGQESPWNYKCPYVSGSFCYTGCVAVAVSQILYYFHYHIGMPTGLYHSIPMPAYVRIDYVSPSYYAIPQLYRSDYVANSTRWNDMALNRNDVTRSFNYVGDLMIDVGDRVGMHYYSSESSILSALSPSIFSHYGLQCDTSAYDFSTVRSSLNAGNPVLITAFNDNTNEGHAWVIDGYQVDDRDVDNLYKWVVMPPDSLKYYSNIDYDYVFTEEDKQRLYPAVEENEIVHEHHYYRNNYLLMNWGWDGYADDASSYGYYSLTPGWKVKGYDFKDVPVIYYNFRNL
jgi:hypothetical protein